MGKELKDMVVGDRVIVVRYGNKAEVRTVERVGRKYLHVGGYSFYKETGTCTSGYGDPYLLTEEAHADKKKLADLARALVDVYDIKVEFGRMHQTPAAKLRVLEALKGILEGQALKEAVRG